LAAGTEGLNDGQRLGSAGGGLVVWRLGGYFGFLMLDASSLMEGWKQDLSGSDAR
jgi:hypothetical protein